MELGAFLLLGLGLVFIVLEVFFPSFGLLGTLAAGSIVAGGVLAWRCDDGVFTWYLMVAFVLGPAVMAFAMKMFPHSWFGRHFTLRGTSFQPDEAAAGGGGSDFADVANAKGRAETPLRPAGKAVLNGRRIDVVTRGELIEAGTNVKVVRVEGNRIVVAEDRA